MLQRMLKAPMPVREGPANGNAYQAALVHSARVRKLRVWLPLGAAVVSLGFIGVSVIRA